MHSEGIGHKVINFQIRMALYHMADLWFLSPNKCNLVFGNPYLSVVVYFADMVLLNFECVSYLSD